MHMKNALTVNVEEWFQDKLPHEEWPSYESKVMQHTFKILKVLSKANTKATFFVSGWVAEGNPEVVKAIREMGHEVASYGYLSIPIYEQTRKEFASDVERSIKILEDITGEKVIGYRAPNFSIVERTFWAWEILAEMGIRYTSSVFPVKRNGHGVPPVPRFPFPVEVSQGGELLEFPLSTLRVLGNNLPVAGGEFLRRYPYWFIKKAVKKINASGGPAVLYFRSWELDSTLPRERGLFLTERRIRALLHDFEFVPLREILEGPYNLGLLM